jgi:hypothetical protein
MTGGDECYATSRPCPIPGRLLRRQFDFSQEPLPQNLEILLCFFDGAERRRHLQRKLTSCGQQLVKLPADVHRADRQACIKNAG